MPNARASRAASNVYAGGGPPGGRDFLDLTYGAFPWLVLIVLAAHVLPAAAGVPLAACCRSRRSSSTASRSAPPTAFSTSSSSGASGERVGLIGFDQIEGWIPVFIFAMVFGLSMDYEVFLVSRMREEWDAGATNEQAVVAWASRRRDGSSAPPARSCSPRSWASSRLDRRPAAVRLRAGDGDPDRRHDRPGAARAERDGALRPLELVAAARRGQGLPGRAVAAWRGGRRPRRASVRRRRDCLSPSGNWSSYLCLENLCFAMFSCLGSRRRRHW